MHSRFSRAYCACAGSTSDRTHHGAGLKPAPTQRHGLPEIVRAFKTFSARRINALQGTAGALSQRVRLIAEFARIAVADVKPPPQRLHHIGSHGLDTLRGAVVMSTDAMGIAFMI